MRVNRRAVKLLGLVVVLLSSGTIYAGNSMPEAGSSADLERVPAVALKIYRNFLLTAEGQFGGLSAPQTFLLDTGTAPSIINSRVVTELGLKMIPASYRAAGRVVSGQIASIPEVDIGPIRAFSLLVLVQDLSPLERDLGVPIAGIVGLDVLSRTSFHLDYDQKEMDFGPIARAGIPVLVSDRNYLAVARVEIAGKPVRLLVDTGTDRLVLVGENFPHVERPTLRITSQTGASLAEHAVQVQVFAAPNIVLGGKRFSKDRAYLVPGGADPDFDGLLGVRALGFHAISYDQSSRTIFLQ